MTDFITIRTDSEEAKVLRRYSLEKAHEEYKYLHLLERIMNEGVVKGDRTGTGTKSLFGTQLSFDVSNSFPILTTKKVFFKGIVEELLWFIRGETDSKLLEAKGVNIWKGNTSREFLDKRGLDYPEGKAGPVYGFQWRYWGKPYNGHYDVKAPGDNPNGIDQLAKVVETIKKNPNDRRMIVNAWNVAELERVALPSCHLLYQFDVTDGKLNCQFYMRSIDSLLGLPFNITSYALLTYMIAKITNLTPGRLTFSGGDTHLYLNHLEQAKEQISRAPYPFPQLVIKKDIKSLEDIEKLQFEDFDLPDYKCHPAIKAEMAI
jgi:thymidylate synthase